MPSTLIHDDTGPSASRVWRLGEARNRVLETYFEVTATILPLFGIGPVLDLGAGEAAVADAWRWRGVDVVTADVTIADRAVSLPYDSNAFGAVVALHVLEHLPPVHLTALLPELARLARYVFVRVPTAATRDPIPAAIIEPRIWWETRFFEAGFGKHPLTQRLTPYSALEQEHPEGLLAFERLPPAGTKSFDLACLRRERDLHMDM